MLDFLILGQGLAGSLLARELLLAGQSVRVMDDRYRTSSSRVAAGLINPLAGMRFNAAPETTAWLGAMRACYHDIGEMLRSAPYFHEITMHRLLRSPEQRRFHERQRANPAVADWLGAAFAPGGSDPGIRAPYGGFQQHATGYVDVPRLLDDLAAWLAASGALQQLEVDYHDIEVSDSGIRLAGQQVRQLVFCEGYRMCENPWFGDLPLQPDKGEILRLESPRSLCRHIINGAHWLVPLADGGYRFGATHAHQHIDCEPTDSGRAALQRGLAGLLEDPSGVQVSEHRAGVRPATRDRRPLIGSHPRHPRLHLFNGFGARGALSIPWYAQRMRDYLLKGMPLPAHADLRRIRR